MATSAADSPLSRILGERNDIPCVDADIIYEGSAVGDNAAGYGRPLVAGDVFRGHCLEKVDNSAGAVGAKSIKVLTGRYRMEVAITAAITDVRQPVYMSDDATYTLEPVSNSYVGKITRYVSSSISEVEFEACSFDCGIHRRAVTLTSAQILLLATTQIELIPAPGADKINQVLGIQMILDYGSNVFTEPSAPDDLEVVYNAAGGTSIADVIGDFIVNSADTIAQPTIKDIAGAAATTMINKAVVLDNTGGNYGGNAGDDSTLTVICEYLIHRAGLA